MNNQETAKQAEIEAKPSTQLEDPLSTQDMKLEDLPVTQAQQDEVKGGLVASCRDANLFS